MTHCGNATEIQAILSGNGRYRFFCMQNITSELLIAVSTVERVTPENKAS